MKKTRFIVLSFLAVCLVFSSCSQEIETGDSLIDVKLISKIVDEKDIASPTVNDKMTSWTYSAEAKFTGKASGATKSTSCDLKDGSDVLSGFSQGLWEFTVHGFNSDGVEIYCGTQLANITQQNNTVTVLLNQYYDNTGKGTISFSLTAPAVGSQYSITCTLKNTSGTDIDVSGLSLTSSGGTQTLSGSVLLDPGLYTLTVVNKSGSETIGGQLITFKMIKGDSVTISGSIDYGAYTAVNLKAYAFSGSVSASEKDGYVDYSFTADDAHKSNTAALSYSWYVNGIAQIDANQSTFRFSKTTPGYYCITCVATYSANGNSDITSDFKYIDVKN